MTIDILRAKIGDVDRIWDMADMFSGASKFVSYDRNILRRFLINIIFTNQGVLFLADGGGDTVGMLAGILHPDVLTGEKMATELFWYVVPDRRGIGVYLLRRFERWARGEGCTKVVMVHLLDLMPEVVGKIYNRLGYEPAEVHHIKTF